MQDWISSFETAKLKATQESSTFGPIQQPSKLTIDEQIDAGDTSEGDEAFDLKNEWRSSIDLRIVSPPSDRYAR